MRGTLPSTITIQQEIVPTCPPILGDTTQLHQVIVNLCTNAFHALREKGGSLTVSLNEVTLAAELTGEPENVPPGQYIRLSITDTGHGMDPATRARIFEPYFTNKQSGEGSGLGLATVHGIIHNHHGYIVVASQLDQGSRFDLYFPASPFTTVAQPVPQAEKPLPKMSGRVLLVDDEEMVIDITSNLLTRCGCQVTPFKNSQEALARFTSAPTDFELVITDQTMPGLTGFALAQKILALQPGMPIILMSGHSDMVDQGKALAAGIRQYIMKPIDIHAFADSVASILAGLE
jgi:CheY-like chemotaxis protein